MQSTEISDVVDENADEEDEEHLPRTREPETRYLKWTRLCVGVFLTGFVVYLIVDTATTGHIRGILNDFLDWMDDNIVAGSFLFLGMYIVCTVLMIPGSALTLGAGYIFANSLGTLLGILVGSTVCFAGASIGATLAFICGRFVFREQVQRYIVQRYVIMTAINTALETRGARLMLLVRLSPIIPFNVLNYALAVTNVNIRDYVVGFLGMIPGTIAFVYIGSTVNDLGSSSGSGSSNVVRIVLYVVGGLVSIAAIVAISFYSRRELRNTLNTTRVNSGDLGSNEADVVPLSSKVASLSSKVASSL